MPIDKRFINLILIFILMSIIFIVIITSNSLSFQHSHSNLVNENKVSDIRCIIEENFSNISSVFEGQTVLKEVFVHNISTFPAFIRVSFFPNFFNDTLNIITDSNLVSFNVNSNWIDGKDGYYYYSKILMPGEKIINPIISFVKINNTAYDPNNTQYKLIIDVTSEACGVLRDYPFQRSWWDYDGTSAISSPISDINNILKQETDSYFANYNN